MRFLRRLFHLPDRDEKQMKTAEERQNAYSANSIGTHSATTVTGNQFDPAQLDGIISMVTATTGIIPRSSHLDGIRSYLQKKISELGLSPATYMLRVQNDERLFKELVNEATVNETYFFREVKQFKLLRDKLFPEWVRTHGAERLPIWSAACSKGEEAYSLALSAKAAGVRAQVTASDINTDVLSRCKEGAFPSSSVKQEIGIEQFLPLLAPYKQSDGSYHFDDSARELVTTAYLNLAKLDSPLMAAVMPKNQQIVFVRNVFIYFDRAVRERILSVIAEKSLREGGYLFVSTNEVAQIDDSLIPPTLEKVYDGDVFYFHKKTANVMLSKAKHL